VTWFAVDDRFQSHEKVLGLRAYPHHDSAVALWCLAGSWCAGQKINSETGNIPGYVLVTLGVNDPLAAAECLVDVGLWERTDAGFAFHDWSTWNGTGAKQNRSNEQSRIRVHRGRLEDCKAGRHDRHCPTKTLEGEPWLCPKRASRTGLRRVT
jgi:hypothetical protein